MVKKVALGVLLVGLIGILLVGAVNRTTARGTDSDVLAGGRHLLTGVAEAAVDAGQGVGYGAGRQGAARSAAATGNNATGAYNDSAGAALNRGGARNNGTGAGNGLAEPQADVAPADWQDLAGTVRSVADDLVEISTTAGDVLPFDGRALRYAAEQGFTLQVGDAVMLRGFEEDGEFKIGQITRQADGAEVILRDVTGRPGWAGGGRWQ